MFSWLTKYRYLEILCIYLCIIYPCEQVHATPRALSDQRFDIYLIPNLITYLVTRFDAGIQPLPDCLQCMDVPRGRDKSFLSTVIYKQINWHQPPATSYKYLQNCIFCTLCTFCSRAGDSTWQGSITGSANLWITAQVPLPDGPSTSPGGTTSLR